MQDLRKPLYLFLLPSLPPTPSMKTCLSDNCLSFNPRYFLYTDINIQQAGSTQILEYSRRQDVVFHPIIDETHCS
jgi:hypothetical protein